jgi:hypothetical protein
VPDLSGETGGGATGEVYGPTTVIWVVYVCVCVCVMICVWIRSIGASALLGVDGIMRVYYE